MCSSLAAPPQRPVSTALYFTDELRSWSFLCWFSPRPEKKSILFDGCMSKKACRHGRTHTQRHSFGGLTQLCGMTKKNWLCNHCIILKKKKAQGDSRWRFLLMLFALVNHAFLPIYHISIFQSFSEGSPSPWSLFWLLCWKLYLCFLNIYSATVQTAETCSSGTLFLEWQTLHINIPRFSTTLLNACRHEMRPNSCVICPGGVAFFKSANVICFLENHLHLGKNSRYMIS